MQYALIQHINYSSYSNYSFPNIGSATRLFYALYHDYSSILYEI